MKQLKKRVKEWIQNIIWDAIASEIEIDAYIMVDGVSQKMLRHRHIVPVGTVIVVSPNAAIHEKWFYVESVVMYSTGAVVHYHGKFIEQP